jgi:hypothetical protein
MDERRDGRHVDRAEHHDVRVRRDDLAGDRREVGHLGREHLRVDGLDAGRLEDLARDRDLRLGELLVDRRIGGRLRALARRQRRDVLREGDQVVLDRDAHVEDVLQPGREDRGPAAGALDERVAVAVGDLRGGNREQGRERPEDQLVVV